MIIEIRRATAENRAHAVEQEMDRFHGSLTMFLAAGFEIYKEDAKGNVTVRKYL